MKIEPGWWFQPHEKYEFVSWDDYIFPICGKNNSHVPNHQPDMSRKKNTHTPRALRKGIDQSNSELSGISTFPENSPLMLLHSTSKNRLSVVDFTETPGGFH